MSRREGPVRGRPRRRRALPPAAPPSEPKTGTGSGKAALSAAALAPLGDPEAVDSLLSGELLPGEDGFNSLDGGSSLDAPRRKKFSVRRFFRNLMRRSKSRTVTVKPADPRQVKLLLVSWSAAILVLATIFVAFYWFTRADPQQLLQEARVAFDTGKYPEAIDRYERFLVNFSYMPEVHPVRVRLGLARLRQAALEADKAKDWSPAFPLAQKLMRTLPNEEGYAESRGEIAMALATLAEGLARQSQEKASAELVEHAAGWSDDRVERSGRYRGRWRNLRRSNGSSAAASGRSNGTGIGGSDSVRASGPCEKRHDQRVCPNALGWSASIRNWRTILAWRTPVRRRPRF